MGKKDEKNGTLPDQTSGAVDGKGQSLIAGTVRPGGELIADYLRDFGAETVARVARETSEGQLAQRIYDRGNRPTKIGEQYFTAAWKKSCAHAKMQLELYEQKETTDSLD